MNRLNIACPWIAASLDGDPRYRLPLPRLQPFQFFRGLVVPI